MPWCPNCKSEYREGFSVCSDCGATLVEEYPKELSPIPEHIVDDSISLVFLTDTNDPFKADMIKSLLEQEGIPLVEKSIGAGGYVKLYMGNIGTACFGTELYVSSEDYRRAQEIIDVYFNDTNPVDESAGFDDDSSDCANTKKRYRYKVVRVTRYIDKVISVRKKKNTGWDFEKRKRIFIIGLRIVLILCLLFYIISAIISIWAFFLF